MIKNKLYQNHDEYDNNNNNNNNNNTNICMNSNQFKSYSSSSGCNNSNNSSNKMNPPLNYNNNIENNNNHKYSQKNNYISPLSTLNTTPPISPTTTTNNTNTHISTQHTHNTLKYNNNNNNNNNEIGSIFKSNENNNNNNNNNNTTIYNNKTNDINTKNKVENINNINCNINNCNNIQQQQQYNNSTNHTNNISKKNIIIGSSYNLKINTNNNNNNTNQINITNNSNNNNIIDNNNNNNKNNNSNTTSSSYNSDNYLSYNCSDSASCSSTSSSGSDNNSDTITNINNSRFINNSCRNSLIYTSRVNQNNNRNNPNLKMTETLNIESLNNYFVNYFQDSLDIELVKIHLNSGYFIAGSNCSGSLEIILNNDIKTAGLNLKWKAFEHVIVCPNSKLSGNGSGGNNNLSKDSSFEIIDASSMLSAYNLKENQSGGGGGSLKSSTSSFLSKSGGSTLKKNSKVLNTLKSSVNTLKNSGSIHSFLKISSSSSSFNLQNHYGIQNNEKCQQKKTIYKSIENIFNTDDSDGIMSAGTHIIPFSFPIPSHLPSSFCDYSIDKETGEKIISAILYRLSVSFVESVQQFKLKKSFSVCEPSIVSASVNEIPLKSEKKKSFIGSSGFIHLKVFLKRNVFFPGEKIPIQLKIENSTSKSIEYIQISIKKIQTLLLNKSDFLNSASLNTGNSGSSDSIDKDSILTASSNSTVLNEDTCDLDTIADDKECKKICKKNSIKTYQKYAGVGSHSNYNETITFNTDEIKSCNQSTNGSLINCKYQLIVQCVIKRTLHSVRIKLPILFGNLPSNDAITSIFEDEYKLYLLNI